MCSHSEYRNKDKRGDKKHGDVWDTYTFVTLSLWVLCSEKVKMEFLNTKIITNIICLMCALSYIGVHMSQPRWSISKLHKIPAEEWLDQRCGCQV